jgi:hypothetical protein
VRQPTPPRCRPRGESLRDLQALLARMSTCRCAKNLRGHAGVSAAGHHHTTDTACGNRHLGIAHEGEILRDRQALHARMSACRCVQQAAKPDPCEGRLQTSHDRRCMCQPTSRQCRPSGRDPTRPATLRACMSACSCAQQAARSHGTRAPTPRANRVSRVCVARSRVRPMVRMYIAHVGADPSGQNNPARSCPPTQDRICKCGARCGAGSRTLAFLAPLVWHHGFKCTVGQRVAGGATRDVAMQTGAQLSSDSGPHVQVRRALRGRISDSRISRPLGVASWF